MEIQKIINTITIPSDYKSTKDLAFFLIQKLKDNSQLKDYLNSLSADITLPTNSLIEKIIAIMFRLKKGLPLSLEFTKTVKVNNLKVVFTSPSGKSDLLLGKFPISKEERDSVFSLELYQHPLFIYNKKVYTPRLLGFFSDQKNSSGNVIGYAFSGNVINGTELTPTLRNILDRVNNITNSNFNAILINKYRDNSDYIGDHSDDEKSLGNNGVVAISLGQSRMLRIKSKSSKEVLYETLVNDEELYWMRGSFQKELTHGIPKVGKRELIDGVRISLTFRHHL